MSVQFKNVDYISSLFLNTILGNNVFQNDLQGVLLSWFVRVFLCCVRFVSLFCLFVFFPSDIYLYIVKIEKN